jgi:hypothetical protein
MAIYDEDVAVAKSVLWKDEKVQVTATERRIGPGGDVINPTTAIATDKRIIIINRNMAGIRKDFESIPYSKITSVRHERGIISSSIYLRVEGYTSPGEEGFMKPGDQEGQIPGLKGADAKALADFIDKMVSGDSTVSENTTSGAGTGAGTGRGGYLYCSKCGAKNDVVSKFCTGCGAQLARQA